MKGKRSGSEVKENEVTEKRRREEVGVEMICLLVPAWMPDLSTRAANQLTDTSQGHNPTTPSLFYDIWTEIKEMKIFIKRRQEQDISGKIERPKPLIAFP